MAETNSTVVTKLIEVLHDSRKGFESIAGKISDPQARTFFQEEGRTRQQFANQLEAHVNGNDVPEKDEGTVAGAAHRAWGNLKGKFGGSDHTLLETAEQGEDTAKRAYEVALKDTNLPAGLRTLIERQQSHVLESHNVVKSMRDQKAA